MKQILIWTIGIVLALGVMVSHSHQTMTVPEAAARINPFSTVEPAAMPVQPPPPAQSPPAPTQQPSQGCSPQECPPGLRPTRPIPAWTEGAHICNTFECAPTPGGG